jgi:hypothetical protein
VFGPLLGEQPEPRRRLPDGLAYRDGGHRATLPERRTSRQPAQGFHDAN